MKKETIVASSDVALVKYWGKKNEVLRLPENGSVSLILEGLNTVTTVEFSKDLDSDSVTIEGESDKNEIQRVVEHLHRIRQLASVDLFARVESKNTFPKGTGLSSSGSGFAALTVAATKALELELGQRDMSILARQGSGTACRCVCAGIVEWKNGDTSESSYSETIFPSSHWDIRDVVAIVDSSKKKVSSTEGHQMAHTSPFYRARLANMPQKIDAIKRLIEKKDFTGFGELVEHEALEFHSILLTSNPPLIAWYPGTIDIMNRVQAMRQEGIEAYFTINTGFNVHVLTLPENEATVDKKLTESPFSQNILHATIGNGPREISTHLF